MISPMSRLITCGSIGIHVGGKFIAAAAACIEAGQQTARARASAGGCPNRRRRRGREQRGILLM
jgi:hypothetical protein